MPISDKPRRVPSTVAWTAEGGRPFSKAQGLELYRRLLLARRCEEVIRREYAQDEMKTPVHLGVGEEAIPVGVVSSVPAGTTFYGTYRNHALYLTVTDDAEGFFAELYGKSSGASKGKAGSMHLACPAKGLLATSAVVGTTLPVAVGSALAHQYRNEAGLVVVFFGDGALEEGVFWESLNFAALRRLNLLFVCEDNGLAIHTPSVQRAGYRSVAEAVCGFGVHFASGDGADLVEVIAQTRGVLARMKQVSKPGFLHLTYYRFLEHVGVNEDFDAGYRRRPTPEEMEHFDPVTRFENRLREIDCPAEALQAVRERIDQRIERAVRQARAAPFAEASELWTDLWAPAASPAQAPAAVSAGSPPRGRFTCTFREALSRALADEMRADPEVFVFGLDVPDHKRIFGSTAGLLEEFGPARCFGTPLSEEGMTGAALGAALSGLRPVHVHIRADFMLLAMNQIVNMISNLRYLNAGRVTIPLVIRAVIGRGWGQSAQHSKALHGTLAHFPGLKVVLPTSAQDAYSLLRASIQDENPVIFLEHRWLYDVVGEVDPEWPGVLGESLVRRPGRDLTIVASSWMNIEAMKAAEVLSRRGVELEVVDVRTVTPLGEEPILQSVRKTGRCLVADYDWTFCGFSAELAARISHACFGLLRCPVERLGLAPVPCPTTRPLENEFYPSALSIIRTAERMLGLAEEDLSRESFYTYEQRFKGPF